MERRTIMELTLARYLEDEGLREELERRAHRERAEQMHLYFAQAAQILHMPRVPEPRTDACA
jgi:hypothetical protein